MLATHPRKRIVAVAATESVISVFPLLFFKHITAGKIASVTANGVILSIDFLEDEDAAPGESTLIALVQKGRLQVIEVYTVGVRDIGGGLTLSFAGCMITCASSPEDDAVARAASRIATMSPTPAIAVVGAHGAVGAPTALSISRLNGCPFLFAVFLHGRVVVGDARAIAIGTGFRSPSASNFVDRDAPTLPSSMAADSSEHGNFLSPDTGGLSYQQRIVDTMPDDDEDVTSNPDASATASSSGVHTPSSTSADYVDGFVTPTQTPTNRGYGEPPAVTSSSRRSRRFLRDIPPYRSMGRRSGSLRSLYSGQDERGIGEDRINNIYVPAYITLTVGEDNGFPTAWVDANTHFQDTNGDGSGIYFTMESGALFVLRWSENIKDGIPSFSIPGTERGGTSPKKSFWIEFVGDVGPAISLAALDAHLLYVANEGADCSLRRVHMPSYPGTTLHHPMNPLRVVRRRDGGRYGLEVRQEFLNLSPISDFVIVSSAEKPKTPEPMRMPAGTRTSALVARAIASQSALEAALREKYNLVISSTDEEEDDSALNHVLFGGSNENEMIVCSGLGKMGSLRFIRPGAPVTVFASSDKVFTACNDMWPMRFVGSSHFDAGIAMSFAQSTVFLLSAPNRDVEDNDEDEDDEGLRMVSRLVNATDALGLIPTTRTICTGLVQDGVVAQIHENGIRLILLQKAGTICWDSYVHDGVLNHSLVKTLFDWKSPEPGIISVGAVGSGLILISLIRGSGLKPKLFLLQCYGSESSMGLVTVSTAEMEYEASCMEIPNCNISNGVPCSRSTNFPRMAIVGTYGPAIEVWVLGQSMTRIARKTTHPWSLSIPNTGENAELSDSVAGSYEESGATPSTNTTPRRPRSNSPNEDENRSRHIQMTAVPESICALTIDDRKRIFVGLRDGSVLCMSLGDAMITQQGNRHSIDDEGRPLFIDSHRKLGHRPVIVKLMLASIGLVILAQAERPWMCTSLGSGRFQWTALCFPGTTALCSFSVPGAKRCFAAVAEDSSLNICGLRRVSKVSVRTLHVGATPRRVLKLKSNRDCIVVATSSVLGFMTQTVIGKTIPGGLPGPTCISELKTFSHSKRVQTGSVSLLPGELVHTLVEWLSFFVVGTSYSIHDANPRSRRTRGRLLLYQVKDGRSEGSSASSSSSSSSNVKFTLCSELALPGAVIAGAAHPTANLFVASCNEKVLVFSVLKKSVALVEVARVSARNMVVGISLHKDIVCVVDRKDSVTFFQLQPGSQQLERDRSDHRRRVVSDAVLVDRTFAMATDRFGAFFSIGFDEGDVPRQQPLLKPDSSALCSVLGQMPGLGLEDNSDEEMSSAQQDESGGGMGGDVGSENNDAEAIEQQRKTLARSLVCHHSYNMNDVAVRLRIDSFCRAEKQAALDDWDEEDGVQGQVGSDELFGSHSRSVVIGTLGGAIATGTGMSKEAYAVLCEVEREMGEMMGSWEGSGYSRSHERFRQAYGEAARGCVDGDLLGMFSELSMGQKREIVGRTRFEELSVSSVQGMIDELNDRVG